MAFLPEFLARADRCSDLPRLGGMARPDGVAIVSERHWAFAGLDGTLREGAMPAPPALLVKIPLVRGLVRLGVSLSPLFRRGGIARRRERWPLAAAVLAGFGLAVLPQRISFWTGLALTLGLLVWMLRGRTLRLHGAEHRAIAAAECSSLGAAWEGTARPSRFSPRCGTNFATLLLPVTLGLDELWPLATAVYTPVLVTLVSLALTMELWRAVQSLRWPVLGVALWPGLALQRLTTREPTLDETRLALRALASVLAREGV